MHALACPAEQEVDDFLARRLPPEAAAQFELHLDSCSACRELVSTLAIGDQAPIRRIAPGAELGRLVVREWLGAGGMGAVYAAHDPKLERRVAVKVLHDAEAAHRLLREGQALARLSHPNVVAVHDVGEQDGRVYIAMELVEGATLTSWLRHAERSRDEVLDVLVQAGRGLAAAHAAGFVHRDFKPDNILVGRDGRARVTDFGLAHTTGDATTGAVVGTPAYMAPEQIDGAAVDARADQFAFCVTLYEALCAVRPFRGETLRELRTAIANRPVAVELPRHLRAVVLRGLAEAPRARFADMPALLAALDRARGWPRRVRRAAVALGGAAVVAALVGWAAFGRGQPELCPDATPRLAGIWDAPAKAAIARAFAATNAPFAADAWRGVQETLERHAQTWVAMHRESCEATHVRHEQSPELLDRRTACLENRAEELHALTEQFSRADARTVERAVTAARGLTRITQCSARDATALPADPVRRARAAALDRALADAKARWAAGAYAPALTDLGSLVRDARAFGEPAQLASTLLALGSAQRDTDRDAGRATLREAARVAEAAGLDAIKADALIALVAAAADGVFAGGAALDDALATVEDARATLRRVGDDRRRTSLLQDALCDVYLMAGKTHDALACTTRALELATEDELPRVEVATGSALHDLGRLDEANLHNERALSLLEARFGPRHPNVAVVLHQRGLNLQEQDKLAAARADFERSLAILEAAYGPDGALVGKSLAALGNTLAYLGDLDAASRALNRARAIYARDHDNIDDPAILDGLGRIERDRGHFDAALALHSKAFTLIRSRVGPDDTELAISHLNLGQLFQARKQTDLALEHYREALRIHEKVLGADSPLAAADRKLIAAIAH